MIYKNRELKQMLKFLEANKNDWLNDEQQEGEPYKITNFGQILQLVDKYFYIEHKYSDCVCIKTISAEKVDKIRRGE